MKKIILTFALLISCICFVNMKAQVTVSPGIKLDATFTNVRISENHKSSSFNPGVSVGGLAKIEFNENFALQPELLFNYTEGKDKVEGGKMRFKYAAVELPIYAVGQYNVGNGKILFGAGPHIGYGFSIDSKTEKHHEGAFKKSDLEMDHWYMGGNALLGYEFSNRLSINAVYQLGFDLSSKNSGSGTKSQTFKIGASYRF